MEKNKAEKVVRKYVWRWGGMVCVRGLTWKIFGQRTKVSDRTEPCGHL